jgi:VIT1/CCC1 family predicted Fe2+/Mn2+ transporter
MHHSIQVGLSFGLTSGIITTLGLMVGLATGTNSRLAVIGGVATIAVADALSDALGIHISEESENLHTSREVWIATVSTAVSKGLTAASFLIPLVFLPLLPAVLVSFAWGFLLLGIISALVARLQNLRRTPVILEHFAVAVVVIVLSYEVGLVVGNVIGS